ncbi:MAG: Hsp20/alpha crystallin family protein [Candidatus Paceibacterota bacterium]|jgi:HSP20 family molecular chaperone IbpA
MAKKRSFLERLTGSIRLEDQEEETIDSSNPIKKINLQVKNSEESEDKEKDSKWEEEQEAELTIDLYQKDNEIIVQAMIAGVHPDNLSINITRDSITIRGKREENQSINKENYFVQELYWGTFSRTISLPEEVNPEEAEAIEKHGLLIIKLPKIDKNKETKLKVKSI